MDQAGDQRDACAEQNRRECAGLNRGRALPQCELNVRAPDLEECTRLMSSVVLLAEDALQTQTIIFLTCPQCCKQRKAVLAELLDFLRG